MITGELLLHMVRSADIQGFRVIFDAGKEYFPQNKGINLIFQKYENSDTFFRMLVISTDTDTNTNKVMEVIKEIHYYSDTPINATVGLAMAAINENIHLN
jgi:hypothetical protein